MLTKISLEGNWKLKLDGDKKVAMDESGPSLPYDDVMKLPGTTSHACKGPLNREKLAGSLTDLYRFEGRAWFEREFELPQEKAGKTCLLHLERTRRTTVWVNGKKAGSRDSLNTPHVYELTELLRAGRQTITICVDNTDYPTKGGHMTSPDTQTNWNGITGAIELQFYGESYLKDVALYPNVADRSVRIDGILVSVSNVVLEAEASSLNGERSHRAAIWTETLAPGEVSVTYRLGSDALLWSEYGPNLYGLEIRLKDAAGNIMDKQELSFGLRSFQTDGDKFTINGRKTFLRGKNESLIFPLTGYAPTDVKEWIRVMTISKSYGINHYRFHTCCPPEAAFIAADMLGIYMEPELPFWGTITEERDENHNQAEQDYLVSEGYQILKWFGNHPSFVMFSLGNELWGSREKINAFLKAYKETDNRRLYTQGSNNHQFQPTILEHDDFYCGVRFSKDRLFRGAYAMCDAPLGHIQTDLPGTMKDYDGQIVPSDTRDGSRNDGDIRKGGDGYKDGQDSGEADTIQIQFGTEAKTVELGDAVHELIPAIPVVSHEIGQFATFPNFEEIHKYTGPLKAENFVMFRERLERKGLGHLAQAYFQNSGRLAAACYKEELEAAFRSRRLAGFQLLDLQDFSGQGTALVGMLDAFMDSKGIITPEEWRTFCNDAVLMARFAKYNYVSGELFEAHIELAWYRDEMPDSFNLTWEITADGKILLEGNAEATGQAGEAYVDICDLALKLPAVEGMTKAAFVLRISGTDVIKSYDLWIYPEEVSGVGKSINGNVAVGEATGEGVAATKTVDAALEAHTGAVGFQRFTELSNEAVSLLEQGENVLLMPRPESLNNAVPGFYCTDFWCYPMFRSISESMNREVPVGTMGLLIDKDHPVFRDFPTESHSDYPWWNIVSHSQSIIMDGLDAAWQPIVQTIDNFERNHKLGLLLECRVGKGRLLICPVDADKLGTSPEGRQFLRSLANYVKSDSFNPAYEAEISVLRGML
ncbi:glycoside hydrolase family 2 TIM barrel-domain containing protein [Paenibacillus sp. CAU 1782]